MFAVEGPIESKRRTGLSNRIIPLAMARLLQLTLLGILALHTGTVLGDSPDNYSDCDLSHPTIGKLCRQTINSSILPTQVLLGMQEVSKSIPAAA